jgi:hypothetical protein
MESAKERKRLGITVPRSTLLPPYMITNPYFVAYTDAMDAVYGPTVDAQLRTLENIRNMWVQNPETETYVDEGSIIPKDTWSFPDRDLVVKQVNMLGLKLQTAGVVSDDAYQTISRFVGIYWFEKGTQAFIEFINYCLSSDLRVFNMWTQDYEEFYNEGDSAIGTPIWEGGTWYPTTHVTIEAKGGLKGLDILTLQQFFYEIANYNLVLRAIDANFDMYIVPDVPGATEANIVAVAIVEDRQLVLSNFVNRGALPPPMHESEQLPSTYYAMQGASPVIGDHYLLAQPTGWTYIDDALTMKVPVYDAQHQTDAEEADIGVKLLGNQIPSNQFNLLYGPIQWMKVPGSTRSSARIPYYTTNQYTIQDGVSVAARAVGIQRTNLLVNPTGFFQLAPGQWVPYW